MEIRKICLLGVLLFSVHEISAQDISLKHYKTTRYDLDIEVDYSEELVKGNCRITIENNSTEDMDTIPLLLYKLFDVLLVRDTLLNALHYSQEVVPFTDWPQYKVNYIQVSLPAPLKPGKKYTLVIEYAGTLMGNAEAQRYVVDHISKTFTTIREDCKAYPMVGVPIDREIIDKGYKPTFDYSIHVTVPKGLIVANPGIVDSIVHTEYKTIYSFSNINLTWRIDICIADYSILENRDLNLKIYYFPEDSSGAGYIADHYNMAVTFYTGLYGKISDPEQFTIIEVPSVYGSQSDVSGVLLQKENFVYNSALEGFYHELSHQWDPPENGGFHVRWNEGLADFHQYYLKQELDGDEEALKLGFEKSRSRFMHSIQNKPEYNEITYSDYGVHRASELSYIKGMMFFTVLYYYMGEEQFFGMMKSYYQTFFIQGASLDDFVHHIEIHSDPGVKQVIKEWIFDTKSNKYIMDGLLAEDIVALYKK